MIGILRPVSWKPFMIKEKPYLLENEINEWYLRMLSSEVLDFKIDPSIRKHQGKVLQST